MQAKGELNFFLIEKKWQRIWDEKKIHKCDFSNHRRKIFSIDTPPPTVSGELHMGHVFSYTQTDFIARFQRMNGKSVFYPIGFDDNGLPTERLIEKVTKKKASHFAREDLFRICNKIILKIEDKFREIYKSLGLSFDWDQEYQTISPRSTKISQFSFIELFNKKKVIRKFGPSFWDIKDKTAISQAESVDKIRKSVMYYIRFDVSTDKKIVIATTRPEMLPSCVAIFYHINDTRYQYLKNCEAIVPFFNRRVPILANEGVDCKKGTGVVMCCTFGGAQDVEWWTKYKLDTFVCIDLSGKMKNADFLDGLKIKDARTIIVNKLKLERRLLKQEEVVQSVKCAERSGEVLEIIPTYQWYIKVLPYKESLHKKNNECNWHPLFMKKRLSSWIDGLTQDWCISRQRYFGVPFPLWLSKKENEIGKIVIADISQLPVDPYKDLPYGYSREDVEPANDVMDTWATSSLTPQLLCNSVGNSGIFDNNKYNKLFPFNLRAQSHEIIRTWTFTTLVKSLLHENSIPWKNLMISGWCLSHDKTKMSKSKDNNISPIKLIKEHSADVVRYWASKSKLGVDTIYNDENLRAGRKLVNKLWNASKFIHLHINQHIKKPSHLKSDINNHKVFCDIDLWILSKLYQVIKHSTEYFKVFEYYYARECIETFFWNDFCDNYLEIVKTRVYNKDITYIKEKESACLTLNYVFNTLIKLFAPFIPHIVEEINNNIFISNNELINTIDMWPSLENFYYCNNSLVYGSTFLTILELVRKYKSISKLSLKSKITKLHFSGSNLSPLALLDLKNACNCEIIYHKNNIITPSLQSKCGDYAIEIFK